MNTFEYNANRQINSLKAQLTEAREEINNELLLRMEMAVDLQNLQFKLARYEGGVEVEGCIEVWQSWGEPSTTVTADLPYGLFTDNQRVKVLVMKGEG